MIDAHDAYAGTDKLSKLIDWRAQKLRSCAVIIVPAQRTLSSAISSTDAPKAGRMTTSGAGEKVQSKLEPYS